MNPGDAKLLKGYVDSDARVDKMRRANRMRALQSELQQEETEQQYEATVARKQRAAVREDALARELDAQASEAIRREKMVQLARQQAPELRQLEQKLQEAYTAKERQNQIQAKQQEKSTNAVAEKAFGDETMRDVRAFEASEAAKNQMRKEAMHAEQAAFKQQTDERRLRMADAQVQYSKEKEEVDAVIAKVQEEAFLDTLNKAEKQAATKQEHEVFMGQRDGKKREEVQRLKDEELAIKTFMDEQNKRKESDEKVKREKEAAKAKILEEQSKNIAGERARKEMLEELIDDLYTEQAAAKSREATEAEAERRRRDREMMIVANQQQMAMREARRQRELQEEQEFRRR
jgi:hypothetical protein